MKVLTEALPSKGKTTEITSFTMEPLTYNQLIKYSSKKPENKLDKWLWEIECLISDIPVYKELSAYDLRSLIFTRKYISATYKDTLVFKVKNKLINISIDDITYKEIPDVLLKINKVILVGKEFDFHIPTIEEYNYVLLYLSNNFPDITPETALVIASLSTQKTISEVTKLLMKCVHQDIVIIEYLDKLLNDTVNDITVKGGDTVISLNGLITDIFQLIRLNNAIDETKISFK